MQWANYFGTLPFIAEGRMGLESARFQVMLGDGIPYTSSQFSVTLSPSSARTSLWYTVLKRGGTTGKATER